MLIDNGVLNAEGFISSLMPLFNFSLVLFPIAGLFICIKSLYTRALRGDSNYFFNPEFIFGFILISFTGVPDLLNILNLDVSKVSDDSKSLNFVGSQDLTEFFKIALYGLSFIVILALNIFIVIIAKDFMYYKKIYKKVDRLILETNSFVDIVNNVSVIDKLISDNEIKIKSDPYFKDKIVVKNDILRIKSLEIHNILSEYEESLA